MTNNTTTSRTLAMLFKTVIVLGVSFSIASCQAKPDTADTQTAKATKAAPKINNATDSDLDVLTDYDRDVWDGPDGWTEEQWRWKRLLRWDKQCDYVADISTHTLSDTHDLIQVMCTPGSYQANYYLFLLNKVNQKSKQLALGAAENTDRPYDISGHLSYDEDTSQLSITTLSRGTGDCGIYRIFDFKSLNTTTSSINETPTLIETRQRNCDDKLSLKTAAKAIFDPTQWPLVN